MTDHTYSKIITTKHSENIMDRKKLTSTSVFKNSNHLICLFSAMKAVSFSSVPIENIFVSEVVLDSPETLLHPLHVTDNKLYEITYLKAAARKRHLLLHCLTSTAGSLQ